MHQHREHTDLSFEVEHLEFLSAAMREQHVLLPLQPPAATPDLLHTVKCAAVAPAFFALIVDLVCAKAGREHRQKHTSHANFSDAVANCDARDHDDNADAGTVSLLDVAVAAAGPGYARAS